MTPFSENILYMYLEFFNLRHILYKGNDNFKMNKRVAHKRHHHIITTDGEPQKGREEAETAN